MFKDMLKKLKYLRVRNSDPKTSFDSAVACEESGQTEALITLIPEVLSMDFARRGLTTRQICRAIRIHFKKYYERDSVSPQMRMLERINKIALTSIVRLDQNTNRYVMVWALPKYARKIKPEGAYERWDNE